MKKLLATLFLSLVTSLTAVAGTHEGPTPAGGGGTVGTGDGVPGGAANSLQIQVDAATFGGVSGSSCTGTNCTMSGEFDIGRVEVGGGGCLSNGSGRVFHDTDCDSVKDAADDWIDRAPIFAADATAVTTAILNDITIDNSGAGIGDMYRCASPGDFGVATVCDNAAEYGKLSTGAAVSASELTDLCAAAGNFILEWIDGVPGCIPTPTGGGGGSMTIQEDDPITLTTLCTTTGDQIYSTESGLTWLCTDSATEAWERQEQSKSIDAVVELNGKSSLEVLQLLAASMRPFLVSPQTDAWRNVIWRGTPQIEQANFKTYGTTGKTAKGILIAPVGALDVNNLPAIDCARNIAGGRMTIYAEGFNPTWSMTDQNEISHGLSVSAQDVCGWPVASGCTGAGAPWPCCTGAGAGPTCATSSEGTGRVSPGQIIIRLNSLFSTINNPATAWVAGRVPYPVAQSGHSTTTFIPFGIFGMTTGDFSQSSLWINNGGKTDTDNIAYLNMHGHSIPHPRLNLSSSGVGLLSQGGGGNYWGSQTKIGSNQLGFVDHTQLGHGYYVAEDCVSGSCSGARAIGNSLAAGGTSDYMQGWIVEGNDYGNIVTMAGGQVWTGLYTEGDGDSAMKADTVLAGGFCSAGSTVPSRVCCVNADCPSGTCEDVQTSSGGAVTGVRFGGQYMTGVFNFGADICLGPSATVGIADTPQLTVAGTMSAASTSFLGGNAITVDVAGLHDPWSGVGGSAANISKPAGHTGHWIDQDPNVREGETFPTTNVAPGELFFLRNGSVVGGVCDPSAGIDDILCRRNAADTAWEPADPTGVGGSGDSVAVDGAATTDPNFVDDGDIDPVLCAGAADPDASCAQANDVLLRYKDGTVVNASLADVPTMSLKGRSTAGTGDAQDLPVGPSIVLNTGATKAHAVGLDPDADGNVNLEWKLVADDVQICTDGPCWCTDLVPVGNPNGTYEVCLMADGSVVGVQNPSSGDAITFRGQAGEADTFTYAAPTAIDSALDAKIADQTGRYLATESLRTAATGKILGRVTAGAGAVEELAIADVNTVLGPTEHCEPLTIIAPDGTEDPEIMMPRWGVDAVEIRCWTRGGGTQTLMLQECTSGGASCTDSLGSALTCAGTAVEDVAFGGASGAVIDADDIMKLVMGTPSGTVTLTAISFCYERSVVE